MRLGNSAAVRDPGVLSSSIKHYLEDRLPLATPYAKSRMTIYGNHVRRSHFSGQGSLALRKQVPLA